jgi:methyl-accepting chemotaxis protein
MQFQDTVLIVFTGVLSIAVIIQSLSILGIYRSIRKMSVWMGEMEKDLIRNIETLSSKVDESMSAIKSIADGLKPIQENLTSTTAIIHNRVVDIDAFLGEVTGIARTEIFRVQDAVHAATARAQETMELLHNSILNPLNEINAFARAIRVGMDILFRKRRGVSHNSAQDEEMFI